MAHRIITVIATCTVLVLVLAQQAQGGPHQDRARREAIQDYDDTDFLPPGANWTSCDITTTPLLSCYDCTTRMICKPVGGLLKACRNPWRPHCNGGLCSSISSPDCTV